MALSGLDIYKLLPRTNCRECGFATCLAFAMQLAKKAVSIDKCPYLSEEAKRILEASSLPPIKSVSIGTGESKLEIGNETVMFRHEEKFRSPCGLGFIIEDNLKDSEILGKLEKINNLKFERVGQELDVNLVAIRQNTQANRFEEAVKLVLGHTGLSLVLISSDLEGLKSALEISKERMPLIYYNGKDLSQIAPLAKELKLPLVVSNPDLEKIIEITNELSKQGINDLILDVGKKSISRKIWDLTQIRRQALKKSNRSLGFPTLVIIDESDPYEEAIEAATYITKYASIVLMRGIESWQVLSLLTLRQNIYT
ncbi:MAG: acetyl-CoA decarbonylase/synthase complex subunit gamma, partial [Candidatus Omnitrophica bacterium]|nr:acetyl-CoA decarbonylase/synthase complex subunit gamma [Candidatus Omnitrophota bacterium]